MATSYELDDIVYDFLINNTTKEKFKLYINLINNIYLLDTLPDFDTQTDLNEIDTTLIEIIEQEADTDSKLTTIGNTLRDIAINVIESTGVILIEDKDEIYLYQLINILSGLYNMFNTNITGADYILNTLRDDNNDTIINLCEILAEYTSICRTEYLDIIDDVQDSFVKYAIDYFNNILKTYNPELDTETNAGIKQLLKVSLNFNNTDVVKDMLRIGLKPNLLSNNLNNLYYNIGLYVNNKDLIPYEIAATLFLCDDSEKSMHSFLDEEINLDLVDFIYNDKELKTTILTQTKQLIDKINSGTPV